MIIVVKDVWERSCRVVVVGVAYIGWVDDTVCSSTEGST